MSKNRYDKAALAIELKITLVAMAMFLKFAEKISPLTALYGARHANWFTEKVNVMQPNMSHVKLANWMPFCSCR